jgi:hypothetical protein
MEGAQVAAIFKANAPAETSSLAMTAGVPFSHTLPNRLLFLKSYGSLNRMIYVMDGALPQGMNVVGSMW